MLAWAQMSGNIVYSFEYTVLMQIDEAYCEEMNKELADFRERREAEQRAELEAARGRGRR